MSAKIDAARRNEIKVWLTETRATARDLFELLGVHKGSSVEEIEKARNHLARLLHPDRWEQDDRRKPQAADAMAMVNAACTILTTKDKRAKYLAELASGRSKCPGCKGEGFTAKQRGFTAKVLTGCATCGGSGLYKERK